MRVSSNPCDISALSASVDALTRCNSSNRADRSCLPNGVRCLDGLDNYSISTVQPCPS